MNSVFVLHHVQKDDEYGDDAKLIGVYSSTDAANAAIPAPLWPAWGPGLSRRVLH